MVRILVQNAGGRRLSYDVNLDDPIHTLKIDIEETEGIPIGTISIESSHKLTRTKSMGILQMNKLSSSETMDPMEPYSLSTKPKH